VPLNARFLLEAFDSPSSFLSNYYSFIVDVGRWMALRVLLLESRTVRNYLGTQVVLMLLWLGITARTN